MKTLCIKVTAAAVLVGAGVFAGTTIAADTAKKLRTSLIGDEEVPAVSTAANGKFTATLNETTQTISYELTYGGVFNGDVTQAHIHLGQQGANGGIMVFLCTNLGNGPAGTPPCPEEGTVTGVLGPIDVVGPAGQGISAGEFEEVARALRAGLAYANVHTTTQATGEIRGQIVDRQND